MSDRDVSPDPVDKAYAEAEAMLSDEAARAARRARILGAVVSEAPPAAAVRPARRLPVFGRGSWLAAASVAGLGLLISLQVGREFAVRPAAPPAKSAPPAPPPSPMRVAPERVSPPPPAAVTPAPPAIVRAPSKPAGIAPPASPPVAAAIPQPYARDVPVAEAMSAPPPPNSARESAAPAMVQRRAMPEAAGRDEMSTRASLADSAARLRQAAAAGRIAEMTALLSNGAAVDGADDEGETALMKTIQANHPAAAALLRRYGASLDRENRAGRSARDMASSLGDADLNRALGLAPGS